MVRRHRAGGLAVAALLLLAWTLVPSRAEATRALDMRWRSLATEHFDIHYYEGEEALAARVAQVAEHAWETLVPLFRFTPKDRCQIVVTDHLDAANGLTYTVPYDRIVLYAFPPEVDGELGSYDDYLHVLFFHEYAHLLHLNTISGLPGLVNTVLGKLVLPNSALPKWYIEGIAVTVESLVSGRGRVGSSRTNMVFRAAVRDDTWLDLAELTDAPLTRPGASGWYLYGGAFFSWLAERFGLDKLIAFQHDYGDQVIPFGINTIARRHFGRDWLSLYAEWSAVVEREARATLSRVEAAGVIAGQPLTTNGEEHDSPRFSPDGRRLAFIEYTGHERQRLRVMDLATGRAETVRDCDGRCHGLAWSPDGESLYYNRYDIQGAVYYRRELFRVALATGRSEQVTEGERVREPDVHRGTGRVLWVGTSAGGTSLELLDPASGERRCLLPARGFDQLAHPRWSPDGRRVALSAWREGDGRRDLFLLDVASGELERLTWDEAMDMHPVWTPDGAHLLFVSDQDGIYNVHALRLADGARFLVTNVRTGAFAPDVSPDGQSLVFSVYSGRGYDLHTMALTPADWRSLPARGPAPPGRPPYEPPATSMRDEGRYLPFATLRPHRLEPTWSLGLGGLANVGAQLSGVDALEQHTWLAAVDFALEGKRWSEAIAYTNRMTPVDVGLSLSHFTRERLAFFESRLVPYEERLLGGSLDLAVPFPHVRRHFALGLGYTLAWSEPIDRPRERPAPDDLVPYRPAEGLLAGPYLALSYSDVTRVLYGFTGEQGRTISLRVHWRHPWMGSDFEVTSLSGHWKEYLRAPWGHHHVFVLRLGAGVVWGDERMRGGYSLGGLPRQDLFSSLVEQSHLGGVHLRGYPASAFGGDKSYLLNAEYRFPLLDIFRGVATLPVWASRLTGAVFADTGAAFSGGLDNGRPNVGVGAELRLQMTLLYHFAASFRLGYARGLMDGGEHQVYFVLGGWP